MPVTDDGEIRDSQELSLVPGGGGVHGVLRGVSSGGGIADGRGGPGADGGGGRAQRASPHGGRRPARRRRPRCLVRNKGSTRTLSPC
eukprot:1195467-Prorocentrum_minimum.AAC.2